MRDIPHAEVIPKTRVYLDALDFRAWLDFGSGGKRYLNMWTYDPNPVAAADYQKYEDIPPYGIASIYCNQVAEHTESHWKLIRQIADLLPPSGKLVFRCPHTWGPRGSHFKNWVKHWYRGNHDNVWWRTAGQYREALEFYFRVVIDMRKERHPWLWPISHVDFLCFK